MDVGDLTRGAPSEDVPSAARWRRGSWDGAAGGGVRSSLVVLCSTCHLLAKATLQTVCKLDKSAQCRHWP